MESSALRTFIPTLVCQDRRGIVQAISGFPAERQCNIAVAEQVVDPGCGTFFMRIAFNAEALVSPALEDAWAQFADVAKELNTKW